MLSKDSKLFIPVSQPLIGIEESQNINKALSEKAISGFFGEYLTKFEDGFAKYIGTKNAVSCSSGTTAIHLAIASLSLNPGEEVLIATLTNMATFFPAITLGLKPVPVDIQPDTLNIDPELLERLVTKKTRAIIVVHLFGHPVDMDPVLEVAKKYNLFLIEDCAQAHGATYKGRKVGSIGDIGCFSFYANKIITTGEGGMITTNSDEICLKAKSLRSLAFGKQNKFMHVDIGYNFRMTNMQAAIGCAQLEKIEFIIEQKRRIAQFYNNIFRNCTDIQIPVEKTYAKNVYWMYHIVLTGKLESKRDIIMGKLLDAGIETREGFIPYNLQIIFQGKGLTKYDDCPIANCVAYNSFYLPSSPDLSEKLLEYTSHSLTKIIHNIN